MRRHEGRVYVIVGAGGLGGSSAARLAAEGASVVIGNRNGGVKAHAIAEEIRRVGGEAIGCELEIADEDSVDACIALAIETYGGLDGLLANAAELSREIGDQDTDVLDISMDVYDAIMRVNLRGHVLCTRAALPHLLERGGGTLLYTSSGAAYTGQPYKPAYSMSKAALHALVRHVTAKWGHEGIRANAVVPGLILTETANEKVDDAFREHWINEGRSTRLGKPEDFSAMVALLFSDEGEWITAQAISIDGGSTICR